VTFTGALLLCATFALVALLAGRLFLAALGAELFRRCDAAGAAAGLATGVAVLTLATVWLSAAGFSAAAMLPLLAALQLVPLALAWRSRRLGALRPCGGARSWVSLAVPALTSALLALLPLLRAGGYALGNDTYTYVAFSEWLQGHGFSEACRWEAQSPVTGIPALWQRLHYDLGIAHWLALVQAASRAPSAFLAYPATAALGMGLLTSMVWLAARQLLRLGSLAAFATAVLFAAVPHALYWGHHNGFLQQAYALPLVLLALVLLARCASAGRWHARNAALVALPFAFLVSVYVPLLPTLVAAAAVTQGALVLRERARASRLRRGRPAAVLAFTAGIALLAAAFVARDVYGLLARVRMFATDVAGGHIPFGALQFFEFATGTRVLTPGWGSVELWPFTAVNRALAPAYAMLALAGAWRAWRQARTRGLAVAGSVLLAGIGYYALLVNDPWTGRRGHTWNVFKLAQWICPFLLLLAAAGLGQVASAWRTRRRIVAAVAWVVPFTLVAAHWTWSRQLGETMQEVLPGPNPLRDLPAVRQRVQALPPGTLLLVGKPSNAGRWVGAITAGVVYPRAIVGDWTESASAGNHPVGGDALYASLLDRLDQPFVVPILAGFVPFQTRGVELLGGGLARLLPGGDPVIVHVMNPRGLERGPNGEALFSMGEGRTKIVLLSRAVRALELELTLDAYPGRPGTRLLASSVNGDYDRRSVRLAAEGTPDLVLPLAGETRLRIPLPPFRGLRTVVLVVADAGSRRPSLTVTRLRLGVLGVIPVATSRSRP
jgi:hypothetical protein